MLWIYFLKTQFSGVPVLLNVLFTLSIWIHLISNSLLCKQQREMAKNFFKKDTYKVKLGNEAQACYGAAACFAV